MKEQIEVEKEADPDMCIPFYSIRHTTLVGIRVQKTSLLY
jgi:hypothetical protein